MWFKNGKRFFRWADVMFGTALIRILLGAGSVMKSIAMIDASVIARISLLRCKSRPSGKAGLACGS